NRGQLRADLHGRHHWRRASHLRALENLLHVLAPTANAQRNDERARARGVREAGVGAVGFGNRGAVLLDLVRPGAHRLDALVERAARPAALAVTKCPADRGDLIAARRRDVTVDLAGARIAHR